MRWIYTSIIQGSRQRHTIGMSIQKKKSEKSSRFSRECDTRKKFLVRYYGYVNSERKNLREGVPLFAEARYQKNAPPQSSGLSTISKQGQKATRQTFQSEFEISVVIGAACNGLIRQGLQSKRFKSFSPVVEMRRLLVC